MVKPFTQEHIEVVKERVSLKLDAGWSLREVVRSGICTQYFTDKYFHGQGWTHQQSYEHGVLMRSINRRAKY